MSQQVPFEKLTFDEAAENVAINDLLTYARSLKDNKQNLVLFNADFGWVAPEGIPDEEDVPMLRIWCDSGNEPMSNNDLIMDDGRRTLSLFFYFYAFGEEQGANIQAQRARYVRHFLTHLSDTAVLETFNADAWRVDFDSVILIDHTQALKRVADYITVYPPWYVTRVDIPIEVFTDYAD